MNVFISAYSGSDLFGKGIFLSLFFLSILTWVLLIQRATSLSNVKRLGSEILYQFKKDKNRILAQQFPENVSRSPFGELLTALKARTLEIINKNKFFQKTETPSLSVDDVVHVENHLATTLAAQVKGFDKSLYLLATIVTLAPFIGLLGTVWGILLTFSGLQAGAALTSNSAVLGGLATALTTTVLGLLIAIPALIAHNVLKNQVRQLASEIETFGYGVLGAIEMQYRQVKT